MVQLKMNLPLHLLGRSLPLPCLSTRFPKPMPPTPSIQMRYLLTGCLVQVIVLGSITWLILDLTIQTISLDLPLTWPEHLQAWMTESSLITG